MNGVGGVTVVWAPMERQDWRRYSEVFVVPNPRRPLDRLEGKVRIRQHRFVNSGVRCCGERCSLACGEQASWVWVRPRQPERVGHSDEFAMLCDECADYYVRTGRMLARSSRRVSEG